MKKILLAFFLTLFLVLNVQAKASKQDFSTVIEDSGVDINSIAVSSLVLSPSILKNCRNGG